MADFYYKPGDSNMIISKFDKLYTNKRCITNDFNIFYNDNTTTHIELEGNSITVLGYAYTYHNSIEMYLQNLLSNFEEKQIDEIKKSY